jgi:hypothetical protein
MAKATLSATEDKKDKSKLSNLESTALQRHEQTITAFNLKGFEVGRALKEINSNRLYKQSGTFSDYLLKRWSLKRSYAYGLIKAVTIIDEILPIERLTEPTNESQVRPLAKFVKKEGAKDKEKFDQKIRNLWKIACAAAEKNSRKVPTADEVKKAFGKPKGKGKGKTRKNVEQDEIVAVIGQSLKIEGIEKAIPISVLKSYLNDERLAELMGMIEGKPAPHSIKVTKVPIAKAEPVAA